MNPRQVLSVLVGMGVFLVGAYLVLRALSVGDVMAMPGSLLTGVSVTVLGVAIALLGAYLTRERRIHRPPRREPRLRDARPTTRRAPAQRS